MLSSILAPLPPREGQGEGVDVTAVILSGKVTGDDRSCFIPRNRFDRPAVEFRKSPLDFFRPSRLRVRVERPIETFNQ